MYQVTTRHIRMLITLNNRTQLIKKLALIKDNHLRWTTTKTNMKDLINHRNSISTITKTEWSHKFAHIISKTLSLTVSCTRNSSVKSAAICLIIETITIRFYCWRLLPLTSLGILIQNLTNSCLIDLNLRNAQISIWRTN